MIASFYQKLNSIGAYVSEYLFKEDPIDVEAKMECQKLIPEIEEVKQKILQLDNFIRSKPVLEKKCLEYMANNEDIISITTPKLKLENFDPNNPVDQRANLKIEKNQFEYLLNKRIRFIKYFPELYELFVKCVLEEQKINNVFIDPLLIENNNF